MSWLIRWDSPEKSIIILDIITLPMTFVTSITSTSHHQCGFSLQGVSSNVFPNPTLPFQHLTVFSSCCRALFSAPDVIEVVLIAKRCWLSSQKTSIAVRFAAPYRFFGYVASAFLSFSSHLLVFWVVFGYLGLFAMLFNPSLVRCRPHNHLVNLLRVVTTVSTARNRDFSPTGDACFKCEKVGHMSRDCDNIWEARD